MLRKARNLGLPNGQALMQLAVQRGCTYYHEGAPLLAPTISRAEFTDMELAIALLNPALEYHPQFIRVGAAMLGSAENDPREVARAAVMERCAGVVRSIAESGSRFEPENPFWRELLNALPERCEPAARGLPHPTRLVAMTGVTRRGAGIVAQWIRPRPIK